MSRIRKRVEIRKQYINRIEKYLESQNKKYNQEWTIFDFINTAIREKLESDMVNIAKNRTETQFWNDINI